jgi:hypothetical protein
LLGFAEETKRGSRPRGRGGRIGSSYDGRAGWFSTERREERRLEDWAGLKKRTKKGDKENERKEKVFFHFKAFKESFKHKSFQTFKF